jgi:4-amino-4-deoxy-L-arabinose transferase-like glycosyltransferase
LVLWHDTNDRPLPDSDYAKYEKLGERLAFEHRYYDSTLATGLELRAYRPPGLPFMMAMSYLVIGRDKAPLVLTTMLGFGVLVASYFLLKPANTVLAAILFGYIAISPNVLFMASISNTQLPFFLIFLLLFLALQRYEGKLWQCVLIGCLLAAGALTRLNMFLVVPFLLLFLWEKHQGAMITAASRFAIMVLVMASVIGPWTYRNYRETRGFIPVSITS